jgi:hypothetical protein
LQKATHQPDFFGFLGGCSNGVAGLSETQHYVSIGL